MNHVISTKEVRFPPSEIFYFTLIGGHSKCNIKILMYSLLFDGKLAVERNYFELWLILVRVAFFKEVERFIAGKVENKLIYLENSFWVENHCVASELHQLL